MQPKTRLGILLICALIVLSSAVCLAKPVYVKTTGLDTNDGLSWDTAKKTVAAGITASISGDEIWVAAGTYVERITLKAGVGLYGGFAGTETSLDQRNWNTHVTTLDGNLGGSVVTSPSGATGTTRIDGFTICNGSAYFGGGIHCVSSSPTITNNTITANSASYDGGGIYCGYSSPTITNNTITQNSASCGGGIYCISSSPTITNNTIAQDSASQFGGGIYCDRYSSPTITNNTITGNSASSSGGGIYCSGPSVITNNTIAGNSASSGGGICCSYSSPTITNNTITGNSASSGGGVCASFSSSPTITNNTITGNTATYYGGAIYCNQASPTIANNTITGNTAGYYGGGIYCVHSSPTITDNLISGNNATIASTSCGGGIYCSSSSPTITKNTITGNTAVYHGGGIACESDSSPTITDNIVAENTADYGGGIACDNDSSASSWPTITNNTIARNTATYDGGIYCFQASTSVSNNIVAFNSSGISWHYGSYYSTRNNCVYGNTGLRWDFWYKGAGDISADPCFVAETLGDYHLALTSPCANAGWNDAPGLPATDMDGNGRIYSGAVDMGAYEARFEAASLPVFSPDSGAYYSPMTVSVICPTVGAVIHCTMNGAVPTESDPIVAGPITLNSSCTLSARAWKAGLCVSGNKTAVYTILGEAVVASIKAKALNQAVTTNRSVVTCLLNKDFFYIESDDRSSGILVFKLNHGMQVGMRAKITGTTMLSLLDKCIRATSIVQNGTGTIVPLVVSNRNIGGGDWKYNSSTKAGQVGAKEYRQVKTGDTWTPTLLSVGGMNNVGLLVATTGRVTYIGTGFFYIDDGSGLMDADNLSAGYKGLRINGTVPVDAGVDPIGKLVRVTGAVSLLSRSGNGYRQVYARDVEILQ